MPSITQLEYVIALDTYRHFARAAKACHVSQPSLSAQLQKMEEEIETIIFDRSKKPILPTNKGKKVISQSRVIVKEYRRLLDLAKKTSDEIEGNFRLAVIPTLSPYLLPLFLEDFCHTYPKVNLIIEEFKTDEIIELLKLDKIDAALLVTPLKDDQIIERALFYEPFYFYASKKHPSLSTKKVNLQNLSTTDIWLLQEGHCFRDQVLNICSHKKTEGLIPHLKFESGSLETLKGMVQSLGGHTLLPYLATLKLNAVNKRDCLREFIAPVPTREVSLIHSRVFLKEDIILAMEKTIIKNLPNELSSKKKENFTIVGL